MYMLRFYFRPGAYYGPLFRLILQLNFSRLNVLRMGSVPTEMRQISCNWFALGAVVGLQRTATKCTKMHNVFCSFCSTSLGDVLVAVAFRFCVRSLLKLIKDDAQRKMSIYYPSAANTVQITVQIYGNICAVENLFTLQVGAHTQNCHTLLSFITRCLYFDSP